MEGPMESAAYVPPQVDPSLLRHIPFSWPVSCWERRRRKKAREMVLPSVIPVKGRF